MRSIVRWCLGNRPVVVLFGLILMGAGVLSIFQLNQELFPSIDFPSVYMVTADPGASPDVVDRDVSTPLANALNGLPHAQHVFAQSSQGFSQVEVQFDVDSNSKDDIDAVNQRVAQVQLPANVSRPNVQTFSFSALPSITYSLAATDGNLSRATDEANRVIAPALQGAKGAAQVKVVGGTQPGVVITLDPKRLAAHGLSMFAVLQALSGAQADVPAGLSNSGKFDVPVQVVSSAKSVDDLRNLVLGGGSASAAAASAAGVPPAGSRFNPSSGGTGASAPSGTSATITQLPATPPVKLGDVASIVQAPQAVNGIARTDGSPSLSIEVIRGSSDNAVSLSDDVRSRLAGIHLDPNDRLSLVNDQATSIKASLNDLLLEGLIGACLAILVIFLFLRSVRATLVTAVSLPTSVLVALLGTKLFGYSLNVLTLAGLTIAVGRIVDDAIVVLENSYRHLQMGEPPRLAALNGASEVSKAVISSTLTTVAVFLPIGVVGGIISKFFLPFSITVTISLLASLLIALTLIPVLVSFFLQRRAALPETHRDVLHRVYEPVAGLALRNAATKAAALVLALLLFVGALGIAASPLVPKNFFDFGAASELDGTVTFAPGTTAAETSAALLAFESFARNDSNVKLEQVTIASNDYGAYTGASSTNTARLLILVKDKKQAQATRDRLEAKLRQLYGLAHEQLEISSYGPTSNLFEARATGSNDAALRQASDLVVAKLQGDPDLANVQSDLSSQKPQVTVNIDPSRAAGHGLTAKTVGQAVQAALSPQPLGNLAGNGPEVTVQLDPAAVTTDKLPALPLGPGTKLSDVATVSNQFAPESISRRDGTRLVTVSAILLPKDTTGATSRATKLLDSVHLPSGVKLETGGSSEEFGNAFVNMFEAIAVAIALVFIILVIFFRSIVTPFVILVSMPLALIGAIAALLVTGNALGLPALLGVLMVFGIVVSNAILLIDFTERARMSNSVHDALLIAGSARLRPILMTAVATVVALLPVAAGISAGGGGGLISQSLAVVVEGGLITSTVFTLIVVPVVYSLLVRRSGRLHAAELDHELDLEAGGRDGNGRGPDAVLERSSAVGRGWLRPPDD